MTGTIEIYFQWMKSRPPFDDEEKRLELLHKLNQLNGVNIPVSKLAARPNIPIGFLTDKIEYQKFLDIITWFMDEVRNHKPE